MKINFNFAERFNKNDKLIVLQRTKKIEKNDLPQWLSLKEEYQKIDDDSVHRSLLTIINAILYQRRIYFVMTRDGIRKLVKGDKNHKKSMGFRDSYWKTIIGKGEEYSIFKSHRTINNVSIYKLTDPELMKLIQINEQEQLTQCLNFVEQYQVGNETGNEPGNKSGNVESKNIRKKDYLRKKETKNISSADDSSNHTKDSTISSPPDEVVTGGVPRGGLARTQVKDPAGENPRKPGYYDEGLTRKIAYILRQNHLDESVENIHLFLTDELPTLYTFNYHQTNVEQLIWNIANDKLWGMTDKREVMKKLYELLESEKYRKFNEGNMSIFRRKIEQCGFDIFEDDKMNEEEVEEKFEDVFKDMI